MEGQFFLLKEGSMEIRISVDADKCLCDCEWEGWKSETGRNLKVSIYEVVRLSAECEERK